MGKKSRIRGALWATTVCAAFVVGASTGNFRKTQHAPELSVAKSERAPTESDRVRILISGLEESQRALLEKEKRIIGLEVELAEVRSKVPPPLAPEEQERERQEEEKRNSAERKEARDNRAKELGEKILQRKDRALRAEALEELAALLESENREDFLVGLKTLPFLQHINCDKERFKPWVLGALAHDDAEIRAAAVSSLDGIFSQKEKFQIGMSMIDNPCVEIRRMAAGLIRWGWREDEKDKVVSGYRALLQDDDIQVKQRAMYCLGRLPEYAAEIEDLAIELSKNPEYAEHMRGPLMTGLGSPKAVRRLIEISDQGWTMLDVMTYTGYRISDEAKPLVSDYCPRTLRNSTDHRQRSQALRRLRHVGDASLIPGLEEIARSPDAEGIEQELAATIEHLQGRDKAEE